MLYMVIIIIVRVIRWFLIYYHGLLLQTLCCPGSWLQTILSGLFDEADDPIMGLSGELQTG